MQRTLSELLEELAATTGITDTDGARHCGVDQTTYRRWRRGDGFPRDSSIPALAALLRRTDDAIDRAIAEQRKRVRKGRFTKLDGEGGTRRAKLRSARQIDQALAAVEEEVRRQADELAEVKELTATLRSLVQNRQRRQP